VNAAVALFDNGQKPSDPQFPLASGATTVQEVFSGNGIIVITDVETPYPPSRYDVDYYGYGYYDPDNYDYNYYGRYNYYNSYGYAYDVQLQTVERVRHIFPEVWIFEDALVCENGTASFKATVPDTITSWIANAFATHPTVGLGVALNTAS
ncbi:unnamed protein product, partial [Candidula unifasciata]